MAASAGARGLTEEEAREETARIAGPAIIRIEQFIAMLTTESAVQNLVSQSSLPHIWVRHVLDSVQLVSLSRTGDRAWCDIGTGAGFPGLVVAMLDRWAVTLIEPRRKRADFLNSCIDRLALRNVVVDAASVQEVAARKFDIVSARAVASTTKLLTISAHLGDPSTRFIFPKGAHCEADVESARRDWHGVFHVEQSCTNPDSGIVVIDQVRKK